MTIPIYRPYVFLRCRECGRKTGHVLINAVNLEGGEIEETYECQECGETKKIYEFANFHVQHPAQHAVKQRLEEPKKKPETAKAKQIPIPEVAEKVEEKQAKDSVEVKIEKKKRRLF